jgi:hypothetical protein
MSRKVFALFGSIGIEGVQGVIKSLNDVDKVFKNVSKELAKTGRQFESLGTKAFKAFTIPITAAGTAIGVLSGRVGEYADNILDLKDITGISTDTLQEFEHVAKISGGDFNSLMEIISKFTNKLPEIVKGGNASSAAFSKLGVSLKDSGGNIRSMNDLFPEMIYALQGIENVSERNALAQDLFGRSLQELGPILGLTKEQIDGLRDESHKSGLVMSEESLQAADKYREMIVRLKEQITILGRELAVNFIPIFKDTIYPMLVESVIPSIKDVADKIKLIFEWFNKLDRSTKESIIKFTLLVTAIGPFLIIIGKTISAIAGLRTVVLLLNAVLLANPYVAVTAAVIGFGIALYAAHENMKKLHEEMANKNAEKMKYGLMELIANYKILQNIDKEPIDEETYRNAIEDIAKLKTNLSDLGMEFSGNFKNDVQTAVDKLDELNGVSKEFEPAVITGDKNIRSEEEIKEAEKAAKRKEELERQYISIMRDNINDAHKMQEDTNKESDEQRTKNMQEDQDAYDYMTETVRKYEEEKVRLDKEAAEKIAESKRSVAENAIQLEGAIFDAARSSIDNKMYKLDTSYEKEKENIEKSSLDEEEKRRKIEELDEKTAKKKRELTRRAAIMEKVAGLFSIGISTAQAIMKAMTLAWPLNLIAAALAAATGVVQTAIVASKPIPAAAKGMLVKKGHGGTAVEVAEADQDEIILPMKTGVEALADALMSRISNISSAVISNIFPAKPQVGVQSNTEEISNKHYHLHVGTYVSERELKRLWRDLESIEIKESTRVARSAIA